MNVEDKNVVCIAYADLRRRNFTEHKTAAVKAKKHSRFYNYVKQNS
jgi:hypothetical protein